MKRTLLTIALSSAFGLSAFAQTFSGGEGTADSPYLITKAADLDELATLVTGGNTLSGKVLVMDKDITVTSAPMIGHTGTLKPIHFAGTFDGKGHKISGLKFNTDKQYCGLFAYVDAEGTVKNLTLQQPTMTTGQSYGGFIAAATDGLIDNCHVINGTFESTNGSYKGGVIGQNKGLVKNCTYSGTITSSTNAGGIIGQNYSQIENCSCSATIVSMAPNQNNIQFGGITGITIKLNSDPHIHDCYFTGNLQGAVANNCGGITGTLSGAEMLRCWNSGYIASTGSCGAFVNSLEKAAKIKDCYNVGTVYDTYSTSVGGLIGTVSTDKSDMSIENCLNMGVIFSAIVASHEGIEFAGANIDALKITNSYFDSQITKVCSQNNGLTTDRLTSGEAIAGFDPTVWKFTAGMYPRLANTADTDMAVLGASPIFLANGETSGKVTSDFTVSTANDVEWEITANSAARLNGNKVTVTRGSKKMDVVLTAYLGNYEKRALVSVYPIIFEGQGTEADPYLINNTDDLMKLSDATNAQAMNFTGEYFKLTADLDMAGVAFVPMAFNSAELAFNGVFDGNGHTIKNLSIDTRTNSVLNAGLFRTVYADGVIKNLTMDKSCKFDIYRNFAPFAATLYGTIENCRNYADIPTTNGFAGGIAYLCYGSESKIINCYNEGNITSTVRDGYMAGITYNNEGIIENCQNTGNITTSVASTKTVAGIAGINKGSIKNVINTGRIMAASEVGGIVSDSKAGSSITNALSLGQVSAFASRDALGGIIGKDAGATFKNTYYDSQIVMFGNVFDGITGATTDALTATSFTMGDEAWNQTANRYPMLKLFADEPAAQLASMPVWFADGMRSDQLTADGTLASANGLTWTVKESPSFKVDGNKLVVTNTDTYNASALTSAYQGRTRTISIAAPANLFAGTGTEADPYIIESFADLTKLSDDIAASGLEYGGKYFKLINDIDAAGQKLTPIAGNGLVEFKGIFDGNGKTISNITISTTTDYTGLFGRVGVGGVVKNLTIGGKSSVAGKSSVGAFAGMLSGTVDNCVNNATIAATAATSNMGGIVGQASGTAAITNCVNNGTIAAGKTQTGGIVGYANGTDIRIANVHNTANITGTTKTGGIVGHMINTTMDNAINDGTVTGTTDVAGIAGYSNKVCGITGAKNHGAVNGATDVAGILAYAYTDLTIADSYNTGDVTATASTAGGIIGRGVAPTVTSSFNAGTIANTKAKLGSTIPGAGGIIGRGEGTFTDVYNVGTVTAEKNVGGFIGYYNSSTKVATFNRVYQAGQVINTLEPASNTGVFMGTPKKFSFSAAYYDSQAVWNITTTDAEGMTTAALAATAMGDAWTTTEGALPTLKVFANDDYARLYSAPVFLAATDNMNSVSSAFTVSNAYGVTWTADNAAFKVDGDKVTPVNGVSGAYSLTATLGFLSRTVTLNLTGNTTGIDAITSGNTTAVSVSNGNIVITAGTAYTIYNISGMTVKNGIAAEGEMIAVPSGLYYLVKAGNATVKVIVK